MLDAREDAQADETLEASRRRVQRISAIAASGWAWGDGGESLACAATARPNCAWDLQMPMASEAEMCGNGDPLSGPLPRRQAIERTLRGGLHGSVETLASAR